VSLLLLARFIYRAVRNNREYERDATVLSSIPIRIRVCRVCLQARTIGGPGTFLVINSKVSRAHARTCWRFTSKRVLESRLFFRRLFLGRGSMEKHPLAKVRRTALIESPFVGCRASRRKRRGAPFESDEITPLCACNRRRSRVESHLARFSQSACFRGAIIAARCFDACRGAIDRGSNRETRFLKPESTASASDDPEAVSQHVGSITDSSALRLEISPSEN